MRKMLNIISFWGNANQNLREVPPYSRHTGFYKKDEKLLLIGMYISKSIMDTSINGLKNFKIDTLHKRNR